MYNRYIPQPDGSYRKDRIPDFPAPRQQKQHKPPVPQSERTQDPPDCPREEPVFVHPVEKAPQHIHQKHMDAGDFLRKLLPKDLDTGDLLIIVLLLLMAGDCKEDKNTALLTLALYFFL